MLNNYPSGQNQADFYIIAYLAKVLSILDKKLLKSVPLQLYSNDENLILAFEFQCQLFGAIGQSIRTKKANVVPITQAPALAAPSPQQVLLKALKQPQALNPKFQEKLGLSPAEFHGAVKKLSAEKRVKRSNISKKKWVAC